MRWLSEGFEGLLAELAAHAQRDSASSAAKDGAGATPFDAVVVG